MKRGSKTAKRVAILTTAFCICSSVAWDSSSSRNDNSVTSLNYSQESARTLVEIGVQADPTFSVYTLKNPERVVVEILDCDSSARISPVQVRNGIIDTAAVSVAQDSNYSTCRVILGLEKEATYAVDSSKTHITVAVDGKPDMTATAMAHLKQSQEEALASAQSMVEREQASARQARAEAEAARQEALLAAEREQIATEKARAEASAAREEARTALEREKAALAKLEHAYAEAQKRVNEVEAQRDAAQLSASQSESDMSAALEAAQAELLKAQNNVAALELARNEAVSRAQAAESQRDMAQAQARESLLREQQAIEKLQKEQEIATQQAAQMAQMNSQMIASQAEKDALLADLNAQTSRAQMLSARAEKAQKEAQRLVEETKRNEAMRVTEAESRVAQAENRLAQAVSQAELENARNALAQVQRERDNAIAQAKDAEAKAQTALNTAESQRYAVDTQLARLNRQLDEMNSQLSNANTKLSNANAKVAQLEAEMARLNAEKANAKVQAATTANGQPAVAEIATTAPIDTSIGTHNTQQKVASAAPIDNQAAAHASVKDIQFRNRANGEGMQVVLKMSAPVDKVENIDAGSQKSVLRIAGAVLPDNFNKKFDTSAFNQGIKFVDSTQTNGGIELIAQSSSRTIDSIEQNGDTITWNIRPLRDASSSFKATVDRRNSAMISAAEPSPIPTHSYGAINNLRDTPLAKRKITLDIHDADINDLLRLLSDEINTSIVVSPEVKGNITLSLKSVPLDQALDIILRMHDLGMRYEGNVIWIAKADAFRAEEERAIKAAEVRERLEPLEVRLLPINYALANELSENVESLLSSRGTVNIDERTNTLILKDVAANLDAAEILVNNLDTQTPQILIEARIVETQANFTKEIGIQWGGDGVASAATGNATGIVFPSTIGIAGGSTSDNNTGTSATPNFAVNLPASVGTGSGGALGVTLGSLGGLINLNIRLSSLEEKGYLKIVSAPRIMTLDNVKASIESGTSIPISVVSAAGAQTVFFDAKLNLEVTPHVTRDGNVYLKINISKNEPDFGNTGANGDPSIIRKEAQTELLIPDGDTTVIGGIYSRNTSQSMSSVPFWGSIPILGYLFRNTSETDNRSELLIFITPRIINRDASISASGQGTFIPPVERESEETK